MISTNPRNFRTLTRRVAVAVGLGYLLLVVAPLTTASLLLIGGGHQFAGLTLLGVSVGVTVLGLLAVGLAWLLVGSVILAVSSFLTTQRRRVLRWAADLETAHWWARLVRPSDRLGFLDRRSTEEKVAAELDCLRTQYVSGELSEVEFERELERLLWTETRARTPDVVGPTESSSTATRGESRLEPVDGERTVR